MPNDRIHPEDDFTVVKLHRDVKRNFIRAIEDLHGKVRGYVTPYSDEAIEAKTEELLAKIKARNGKG